MQAEEARPSTWSVVVQTANPTFIVVAVGVPIIALIYSMYFGPLVSLDFVHIMTGAVWTGTDLFFGFVLAPVRGGMDPPARAAVFRRLVPKMTFLMPALATVAMTSGINLALRLGYSLSNPWCIAALVIVAIMTIQGFGILLPNEIRVFQQLLSKKPNIEKISRLGMLNAKLGGVQGLLQVAIIIVMAKLRMP